MRTILKLIHTNARAYPESDAIVLPDRKASYGDLWRMVSCAQVMITKHGFNPEAPVGLLVNDPIRHVVIRMALMCRGITSCAVRPDQLADLKLLGINSIITDIRQIPLPPSCIQVTDDWFDGDERAFRYSEQLISRRIGFITFTTGSTGTPKAIAISMGAIRNYVDMRLFAGFGRYGKAMTLYGLSTIGIYRVFACLAQRSTIYFAPQPQVFDILRRNQIPQIEGSVSQIRELLNFAKNAKSRLRLSQVLIASAAIGQQFASDVERAFGCELIHSYSTTETSKSWLGKSEQVG